VLTPSGGLVGEPFLVLGYDRGNTAWPSPQYWLRSTNAGEAVLFWEAPTRTRYFGRALMVSKLGSDLRAGDPVEVLYGEHGVGTVAIACADSCLLAQGLPEGVVLRVVGTDGRVARREVVPRSPESPGSALVADADRDRYVAGWIESDGTNVDGYVAVLSGAAARAVSRVAQRIPNGDGMSGSTPDPFGVTAELRFPALVFQTTTTSDVVFLLHDASPSTIVTRRLDLRLGEATLVDDVLVAIGGLVRTKPAEPVSVLVRRASR
jgi:hypothetical protein